MFLNPNNKFNAILQIAFRFLIDLPITVVAFMVYILFDCW